ncbi:MAG: hypothetical protein A2428_02885 [Bdellovibrionales bacterium RIFOXYC1_FULL_54_43]|nr:MAG: hypothetical protein A2428_02885 [Bdellovibrionales bacterium RIFOXYC1_FULL_54_43]OFZ83450.1 MAG: hypothetical protein A2603_03430 [Bdellovibrionales bacterium RIFOXYD1_FULL_55_31]
MKQNFFVLAMMPLALSLGACNAELANYSNDGSARIATGSGKLKLRAMARSAAGDDLARQVQSPLAYAEITIREIQIRSALDGNFYAFQITPIALDLMSLNEGFPLVLARAKLPAGTYDLIRLITDETGLAKLEDGRVVDLRVPSGPQTGIKVFFEPALTVAEDRLSVASFEFDVDRSFVLTANGYHFKPVIRPAVIAPIDINNGVDTGIDPGVDTPAPGGDPVGTDPVGIDPVNPVDPVDGTDPVSGGDSGDGTVVTPPDYIDDNFLPVIGV